MVLYMGLSAINWIINLYILLIGHSSLSACSIAIPLRNDVQEEKIESGGHNAEWQTVRNRKRQCLSDNFIYNGVICNEVHYNNREHLGKIPSEFDEILAYARISSERVPMNNETRLKRHTFIRLFANEDINELWKEIRKLNPIKKRYY